MIEIKNLTKVYDNGKKAIDDINLTIKDGEIFGFLGPNGAGKSSTIKSIIGINKPTNGEILINGIKLEDDQIKYKDQFSYVPDNPDLFTKYTGNEYLNFLSNIYKLDLDTRKERIDKYAKAFELEDALDNQISSYSHGMAQRLALIGALIHNPSVLILDEPMVGLDPKSSHNLKEIMREIARDGKTVFFSTHVMEIAEQMCDRIAIIKNGKIIACGTYEEIKKDSDKTLEELFLELTDQLPHA